MRSPCLKTRATGPVGEAPNHSLLGGKQASTRVPDRVGAPEDYGDWQVLRKVSQVTPMPVEYLLDIGYWKQIST